jgi:hypothetical protein
LNSSHGLVGVLGLERGFELGRRDVVEVAVAPFGVEPVDPAHGGQLDGVDAAPWSSPSAGKTDNADFRISLARTNSRTSCSSRGIRGLSSVVTPGRSPASTSAGLTDLRTASTP